MEKEIAVGCQVRCTNIDLFDWGCDPKISEKYLKIGYTYTVDAVEEHSWHTEVWLREFPDPKVYFNSCRFEVV